jgi:hypothetical protein
LSFSTGESGTLFSFVLPDQLIGNALGFGDRTLVTSSDIGVTLSYYPNFGSGWETFIVPRAGVITDLFCQFRYLVGPGNRTVLCGLYNLTSSVGGIDVYTIIVNTTLVIDVTPSIGTSFENGATNLNIAIQADQKLLFATFQLDGLPGLEVVGAIAAGVSVRFT